MNINKLDKIRTWIFLKKIYLALQSLYFEGCKKFKSHLCSIALPKKDCSLPTCRDRPFNLIIRRKYGPNQVNRVDEITPPFYFFSSTSLFVIAQIHDASHGYYIELKNGIP